MRGGRIESKIVHLKKFLQLDAAHTVGFLLFPDLSRLQNHPCDLTGSTQPGSPVWKLPGTLQLSLQEMALDHGASSPWGRAHVPASPDCPLDGPLKAEARKASLSY